MSRPVPARSRLQYGGLPPVAAAAVALSFLSLLLSVCWLLSAWPPLRRRLVLFQHGAGRSAAWARRGVGAAAPRERSVRLSVSLSPCLSVSLSLCLSVSLSVCLSLCLSVCLSVPVSVRSSGGALEAQPWRGGGARTRRSHRRSRGARTRRGRVESGARTRRSLGRWGARARRSLGVWTSVGGEVVDAACVADERLVRGVHVWRCRESHGRERRELLRRIPLRGSLRLLPPGRRWCGRRLRNEARRWGAGPVLFTRYGSVRVAHGRSPPVAAAAGAPRRLASAGCVSLRNLDRGALRRHGLRHVLLKYVVK